MPPFVTRVSANSRACSGKQHIASAWDLNSTVTELRLFESFDVTPSRGRVRLFYSVQGAVQFVGTVCATAWQSRPFCRRVSHCNRPQGGLVSAIAPPSFFANTFQVFFVLWSPLLQQLFSVVFHCVYSCSDEKIIDWS
eukprot:Hpha_TRINITY_DN30453_c0_g1::TRINITY_DN30453_c0_g1_i1::g.168057::m.168057